MGCGKSTTLRWFKERGCAVFETDAFVREAMAHDEALHAELRKAFGDGIFQSEGGVDRGRLGSIVFEDPPSLAVLESIVHPRVRSAWQKMLETPVSCLVVEIPLLFEKNLESAFDLTCCVLTDPRIQMNRLRLRGWSDAHIVQRLERQWPVLKKASKADVILLNDGTPEHLEAQLERILSRLGGVDPSF